MRKTRIKGGNQPNKQKKTSWLPKPLNIIVNKVLPVIVLLVIGYFFAPNVSMNFQNNNVEQLDNQTKAVMFYKADCSTCQKLYPTVFWHNVLHFKNQAKQVQTINVANVNNQHYVPEQSIESTPTFKNLKTGRAFVITDKQQVKQYLEKGEPK
ncbi:thioredoxin domain-containing protein [Leuconostoc citreum]|uniref:thioredoxin domain-containing protein n=1 Tax=Leuconostoc citreum TaxID=33964 RepID=UPI003134420A